jgi:hypothetical protein
MLDVSAIFPKTSRDEVKQTRNEADPGVAKWVDSGLGNRLMAMELDGNCGPFRSAGSGLSQGSPLSPVLFGLRAVEFSKNFTMVVAMWMTVRGQFHSTN